MPGRRLSRMVAVVAVSVLALGVPGLTAASAQPADDEPIEIVSMLELGSEVYSNPQTGVAARAAVKAINAAGGINGRHLKLTICDSKNDPNRAQKCARDAVAGKAVAAVASANPWGDTFLPILEEADLPYLANLPVSAAEYSNPISFPIVGGGASMVPGMAAQLVDAGSKKIHLAYIDSTAGKTAEILAGFALTPRGESLAGSTPVPPNVVDPTPQVAAATSDADGVILAQSPQQVPKWLRASELAGVEAKQSVVAWSLLPADIEELGKAAEGAYVVSLFPPVTSKKPGIKRFIKEMNAIDKSASKDDLSLGVWVGMHAFAQVAEGLDEVTRETVLEAWNGLTSLDVYGLLPPGLNLTEEYPMPGLNRLFNPYVVFNRVKNGALVASGAKGYVNPFEG